MRFCYLCGVGRSGSTWLSEFLGWVSGTSVRVVHFGLAQRTAGVGSGTLGKFLALYLERLQSVRSAETVVECEGTWLDRIAMHYNLPDAAEIIDAMPLDEPARGAMLVRHPFGYVASVKASGWLGGWWKRPHAYKLAGMVDDFEDRPIVEQAAISWQLRNAWFLRLVPGYAGVLTYEELLGKDTSEYSYRDNLDWLLDNFGIEPVRPRSEWINRRSKRVRSHNQKRVELDDSEKAIVRRICEPMMAELGYR